MTFESFYESLGGQFDREAVPCPRAQHGKVLPTNHSSCTWHDECPAVCADLPSTDATCRGTKHEAVLTAVLGPTGLGSVFIFSYICLDCNIKLLTDCLILSN